MLKHMRLPRQIKFFQDFKRWQSRATQISIGESTMDISTGDMAQFADGSATVKIGDTEVLGTVVSKIEQSSTTSFLPLTVDFSYALSTTNTDILTSRMIDRSIRPMFSKDYRCETQVVCSVESRDKTRDPVVASINAASAALAMSDVPWNGPIGAVQVGIIDGKVVINPTKEMLDQSQLNMVVSTTEDDKIVMIDGAANILPVALVVEAIREGADCARRIVSEMRKFSAEFGKVKREFQPVPSLGEEMKMKIDELASAEIEENYKNLFHDKIARDKARQALKQKYAAMINESHPDCSPSLISAYLDQLGQRIFRNLTMKSGGRYAEVRGPNEIRVLSHKIGLNPSLHGSSVFQRGGTQVRATLSFEPPHYLYTSPFPLSGSSKKNFFLHYNFPAYATNETGRMMHGRREVGHGALASKGLRPIIPPSYEFAIRIDAVVQQSSGSSSMASVCAGSLALQDAGVPILEPAAGVAMGVMVEENKETGETESILLPDISGIEDALGDMDFKVAGTKRGLTAMQLDTKLPGMPIDLVFKAIRRAHVANGNIIDDMSRTTSEPLRHKENRPITETLIVPTSKRAKFLGINRSNIKSISEETGVTIASIDDSTSEFQIFAPSKSSMVKAQEIIQKILSSEDALRLEMHKMYKVKIVEMKDSGIFVELHPSLPEIYIPSLLLEKRKGFTPSMTYKLGQLIYIKYLGNDPKTGKIRLSKIHVDSTLC